ncbi:hypothetical protein QTG54_008200 [Skeletonema marinoi]|uniref:Uncharacterized protein n=1 Tax=Skeletonema marinoi TaxID=267567 RepID=A0AAD8Y7E9_9STRA|nr:hypothetical protein QTG54_008200 [Skeletonema marinoi]
MALDPKSKLKLDLSVFGDGLEIPDSVTPISRVSPSLMDGGSGGKKEEESLVGEVGGGEDVAAEGDAMTMERNFDHLFDDDEEIVGVKEDTTTDDVVATSKLEEDNHPSCTAKEVTTAAAAAVTESIPLALAPTIKKTKSKRPRAKPKAKRAGASKK